MDSRKHLVGKNCTYVKTDVVLGSGSFGDVFLAYVENDESTLTAIKEFQNVNEIKELIGKEVKYLQLLSHQNTLQLIDKLKTGTHWYLVLEYCDGDNLTNFLERYKKTFKDSLPSAKLIKHFATQIASGISYVHAQGIAHRDLKPDNIMITFNKEAREKISSKFKIDNFGLVESQANIKLDADIASNEKNKKRLGYLETKLGLIKEKKYFFYEEPFCSNKDLFDEIMLLSTIKIIDFGLSKEATPSGNFSTLCGNYETLCPELVIALDEEKSTTKYNNSVDLWSLAYIIVFLSTGKYPFTIEKKKEENNDKEIKDENDEIDDTERTKLLLNFFNKGTYYIDISHDNISWELISLVNSILQRDSKERLKSSLLLQQEYFTKQVNEFTFLNKSNVKKNLLFDNARIKLSFKECVNSKESLVISPSLPEVDFDCENYFICDSPTIVEIDDGFQYVTG